VEKAALEMKYDFGGVDKPKNDKDIYGLRYDEFVVPLVKAVQELSKQNEQQQQQIEALKALVTKLAKGQSYTISSMGSLSQNIPNPVTGITRISYSVPAGSNRAQLLLTNKLGERVKIIAVAASSSGTVDINTTMLSSGSYNYSLVVDGKAVETKTMVVVHDK
jgi:hypothetical protein